MKAGKIMKTILLILVIIAVIARLALLYIRNNREKFILDGPGMINTRAGEIVAVSYSYGGGMEGESLYYSLTVSEDCTTSLFEYSHCPYNGADTITAAKEVSIEYFDNIRKVCGQTECLLQAHNGKPSELQLLDAPVSHITFTIYDGEFISLHSNYDYPSSCNGLFSMVVNEMEKIMNNEIHQEDIITISAYENP